MEDWIQLYLHSEDVSPISDETFGIQAPSSVNGTFR